MMIKTSHSCMPKKLLERTMSNMPGGTWIVMEGQVEKEYPPLVCISNKYNKKSLYFLQQGEQDAHQGGIPMSPSTHTNTVTSGCAILKDHR